MIPAASQAWRPEVSPLLMSGHPAVRLLATLLLVVSEVRGEMTEVALTLGVVMLVLLITLTLLLATNAVMRVLGVTGANVVSRLLGVVLTALAVQYVIDGIRAVVAGG